jgi:hypothetical protein
MSTHIATLGEVYRDAKFKAESGGARPDWQKWLIIAAAILGALILLRTFRSCTQWIVWLFWIWFWTHGAWHWIF